MSEPYPHEQAAIDREIIRATREVEQDDRRRAWRTAQAMLEQATDDELMGLDEAEGV